MKNYTKTKIQYKGTRWEHKAYLNDKGEHHRLDGPAVENADGGKAWYLEGVKYTQDDWKAEMKSRLQMEVLNKL